MTATAALLKHLRGGLIVSVQANVDSVLNTPEAIALLARCAEANGAAGVRIEGVERIAAVRAAVALPLVGIIKCAYDGYEPYITTTLAEVTAVAAAGATIVAFDATDRRRSGGASVGDLVAAAHRCKPMRQARSRPERTSSQRRLPATRRRRAAAPCRPSICSPGLPLIMNLRCAKAALGIRRPLGARSRPERMPSWWARLSRTSTFWFAGSWKPGRAHAPQASKA